MWRSSLGWKDLWREFEARLFFVNGVYNNGAALARMRLRGVFRASPYSTIGHLNSQV